MTELARVAPAAIRDDVGTVLDAGRQRAGLPVDEKVSEADASAADERVLAFEEDRCAS